MNITLKYFSGTGNSFRIINECKKIFIDKGNNVELDSITENVELNIETHMLGFCFPVYAFDIPRICSNYLKNLPKSKERIKAFVLITAGDPEEAGFSFERCKKILSKKNIEVIYSDVIHMPANWTVAMNPPSMNEAINIIAAGVKKTHKILEDILNNKMFHHKFNYPPRYSKFGFYKDYFLFKWMGLSYFWRTFQCDESCNACGICEKMCPTKSIKMIDNKPQWAKTCEQCMRCVNYCPKQAIFQKHEGSIKGKNTYHEPSFKPLALA